MKTETEINKNAQQAKALWDADITVVVMDGKDLTFDTFEKWVDSTISLYSSDDDWEEMVDEFDIDMDYIESNTSEVFAELKKLLK